jgi:hypothetical protein
LLNQGEDEEDAGGASDLLSPSRPVLPPVVTQSQQLDLSHMPKIKGGNVGPFEINQIDHNKQRMRLHNMMEQIKGPGIGEGNFPGLSKTSKVFPKMGSGGPLIKEGMFSNVDHLLANTFSPTAAGS